MFRSMCRLHPLLWKNVHCKIESIKYAVNEMNNGSRYFSSQSSHIVQMRGLDIDTKEKDVIEFFKPLGITPKAVHLKCDGSGRVSGVSEVEFATHAEAVVAMRKRNAFIGNRFVRLAIKSSEIDLDQYKKSGFSKTEQSTKAKEFQVSATTEGSYYTGHIVKMKNAPRRMTEQAIYEFFWPVGVSPVSVKPLYNESGIRTGEFEVKFLTKNDAIRAMAKNNAYIGRKFVELSVQQS